MDKRSMAVIMAGASGLVGQHVLEMMLKEQAVSRIYSLVRKSSRIKHKKLHEFIQADLQITHWDEENISPELGVITLGTTLKQAGSKKGLEKIDYELVCQVAQTMKTLGVKRLAVVSSLGAKARSSSHYLRCKGRMRNLIPISAQDVARSLLYSLFQQQVRHVEVLHSSEVLTLLNKYR